MGKMVTIVYAMVGMPLFLLYVSNMGDFLATCFRWGYVKLCKCNCGSSRPAQQRASRRRISQRSGVARQPYPPEVMASIQQYHASNTNAYDPSGGPASVHQRRTGAGYDGDGGLQQQQQPMSVSPFDAIHHVVAVQGQQGGQQPAQADYHTATVPLTISLTVMVSYMVGGAVLFQQWETDWDYLDGSYFCFISLSTTGFGDLVPGDKINSSSGVELSLIFCSMYLIIGMALIAMCFNLMQEEVIAKVRKFGQMMGCIKPGDE